MTQQSEGARWREIADLIEQVAGDPALIDGLVDEIRTSIREISALDASDVARHTRALLAASTRALVDRRGPTDAELSFVEDLATTRARQGVPIHAVLAAIHVAERRIWARAREVAVATDTDLFLLLEARELYDDWAAHVRLRLMTAHATTTRAPLTQRAAEVDRDADAVRRLLQGGSAAAMAAAAVGLPPQVVVMAAPSSGAAAADLVRALRRAPAAVAAVDGDDVVAVLRDTAPTPDLVGSGPVGAAGPGRPEDVPALRRLAVAAARVAAERGMSGVVPVGTVAPAVAMLERPDLVATVLQAHGPAIARLGRRAAPVVDTVRAWLECGCDAEATAARGFVHANTVRNRVAALAEATGLDPHDPFAAVDLWWLCRAWQARG